MTLTLEIAPEVEAALTDEATRHGQSVNDYAAQLLADALEDALDLAECERVRAEVKDEDLIPWEQVKAEAGL
jgi:hypothetical protein